jgi:hypothetical protein
MELEVNDEVNVEFENIIVDKEESSDNSEGQTELEF